MTPLRQPMQPGAAVFHPLSTLSDEDVQHILVRFMSPTQWIKLAAVNQQCLRVVTSILQEPVPVLLRILNGCFDLMDVDLRRPLICGRSALTAHVYPLTTMDFVSRVTCRVEMTSTMPMEFALTPLNPANGVLYSQHGGPWQHTLLQSISLRLSDSFALDVQQPGLARAAFKFGCLLAPNLTGLLSSTQPVDELDAGDDVPSCLLEHLLSDDLISSILGRHAPRIHPNPSPRDLLGMMSHLKLRGVAKSWKTLLASCQSAAVIQMNEAILRCGWAVWANDPIDRHGVESVFLAGHSAGKGELMLLSAFPTLSTLQVQDCLRMPAHNVFLEKKGGTKPEALERAWTTISDLIAFVEGFYDADGEWVPGAGDNAVIWGCGGGPDRAFVQCSMASPQGWINPDNMRPLNGSEKPAKWNELGIRKTLGWESQILSKSYGYCKSINLTSSANGTGTYRAELWRGGQLVHTFIIGVFPHPGSQSWGDVESKEKQHAMFLRNLVFRTPSQAHVIRINADDFD